MRTFTIARWLAIASLVAGVVSLLLYPGGTFLDPKARGYSFAHNLLSDAGLTVAFNGQANAAGSSFAVVSYAFGVIALVFCTAGLIRAYSSCLHQKRISRAAAALLLLSCVGWVVTALSPADRSPVLHMYFGNSALGLSATAALLFAVATAHDRRFRRTVPLGWVAVALLIPALVTMRWWGPPVTTERELMYHAIAQKFAIFASIGILIYQSYAARRAAPSARHSERV